MVTTRLNKRAKNAHDSDVEMVHDDATLPATNGATRTKEYSHVSFLKVRAEVLASKKGTATMKAKLQEIFKIILEADEDASLSIYQTDPAMNSKKNTHAIPKKSYIQLQHFLILLLH